ncbi:hypothetical protein MRX96_031033 [Rhipicephalus microplus]
MARIRCASSRERITDNETLRARPRCTPADALSLALRPALEQGVLDPASFFSDRFIGRQVFVKCQIDGDFGGGQVSAPSPRLPWCLPRPLRHHA